MSNFQRFCTHCIACDGVTSKAYARTHEGKCKACFTGVLPPERQLSGGRCEDYPCCGHAPGECPMTDGNGDLRYRCARCGKVLPPHAHSSLCARCERGMYRVMDDDPTGQDLDRYFGVEG